MNPELLSTSEAAVFLGCSVTSLWRALKRARQRGHYTPESVARYGNRFYRRDDLLKFAQLVRHAA